MHALHSILGIIKICSLPNATVNVSQCTIFRITLLHIHHLAINIFFGSTEHGIIVALAVIVIFGVSSFEKLSHVHFNVVVNEGNTMQCWVLQG